MGGKGSGHANPDPDRKSLMAWLVAADLWTKKDGGKAVEKPARRAFTRRSRRRKGSN